MPLTHDFDLVPSHLQSLSSREAVAAFFASLGYNTDARLTQTAEAMGLTTESLKREIRHIERIADHESGALQVYLAELKSATVANTQAIARALRNRAGNFLWVLTADYDRLDFVLMEPTLPSGPAEAGISLKGAYLRPRVLTVMRRNPDAVQVRVLRRFSYTEADADYQFQKLQSAYGIAEWSEQFYNNRALFADYYLNSRLMETPEWREAQSAAAARRDLLGLMADARQRVSGKPEAVARKELLEPVLKELGFALTPTPAPSPLRRTLSGVKRSRRAVTGEGESPQPDYYLYAGGERSVAICNVYAWERILDGRDEQRDPDTPDENPGALVVSLLEREDAPEWAIVTNGKTWRLYWARAHSRATNYYEIDLEETMASPEPDLAFRYFWLFFRAAAFTPGPSPVAAHPERSETQSKGRDKGGVSFLNWLVEECALYAKELEERLKDRVFGEIFSHFAEGFGESLGGSKALLELDKEERAQQLDEVFHGTLTFLYRLLFLFYAEARNLLPVKETRGYWEISLTRLAEEVSKAAGTIEDEAEDKLKKAYRADSTALYDRLFNLFRAIDYGEAAVNVPLYNGGLFITDLPGLQDPAGLTQEEATAHFLLTHKIPDRYLALGWISWRAILIPRVRPWSPLITSRWACVNSAPFTRACSNSNCESLRRRWRWCAEKRPKR